MTYQCVACVGHPMHLVKVAEGRGVLAIDSIPLHHHMAILVGK